MSRDMSEEVRRHDRLLVNGKPLRFRWLQQLLWKIIVATLCVAAVAAAYYLALELRWNIGPIHFWAKSGWDSLISRPWWDPVRHDIRDVYEGIVAYIGIGAFTAPWKRTVQRRVPAFGVIWRVAFVIVVGLILAAGGAWLLNVGFPAAWHALFGHHVLRAPRSATSWMPQWLGTFLSQYNWQPLVLGLVIGRIIHPVFQPAGETIQGYFVDRAVAQSRKSGKPQTWARLPLAPPVVRERYSWMMDTHAPVEPYGLPSAVVINVLAVIAILFAAYGEFIKLWFAKHGTPGNLF